MDIKYRQLLNIFKFEFFVFFLTMHHRWQSGSRQVIENFLEIIIINWPPDDKGGAVWTGLQECLTDWPIYVSKATDNADVWSFCTQLHTAPRLNQQMVSADTQLTLQSNPMQCKQRSQFYNNARGNSITGSFWSLGSLADYNPVT